MAEIFDYDDYRDMIKDYYLEHTLSAKRLAWIQVMRTI